MLIFNIHNIVILITCINLKIKAELKNFIETFIQNLINFTLCRVS